MIENLGRCGTTQKRQYEVIEAFFASRAPKVPMISKYIFNKWIYHFATNPKVTGDQLQHISQFIGHGEWSADQDPLPAVPARPHAAVNTESESVQSSETLRTGKLKNNEEEMVIQDAVEFESPGERSNGAGLAEETAAVTVQTGVPGTNVDNHTVLSNYYGKVAETAQDWRRKWDVFAVPKKLPSQCSQIIDEHVARCLADEFFAGKCATTKDTPVASMILTEEESDGEDFSDDEDDPPVAADYLWVKMCQVNCLS